MANQLDALPTGEIEPGWDHDTSEVLRENTAQAIHQQLEELDNLRDQYSKRWIWELFQNALDAQSNVPVSIQICFRNGRVLFRHNGAPFRRKEILHLILHGSTKRENVEAIGRYGTGFLTTHVLSRAVRIRGTLNSGEPFDFVLDRSGTSPAELSENMKTSIERLRRSTASQEIETDGFTSFEYEIAKDQFDLVQAAMKDLLDITPLVMLFNPALADVKIDADGLTKRFVTDRQTDSHGVSTIVEVVDQEGLVTALRCCLLKGEDIAIAIPLEIRSDITAIQALRNVPRLFVAFPLFGTETLPLPFILNCPRGKPRKERDSLFLGTADEEDNRRNKAYIEDAWQLFSGFLSNVTELDWRGLINLARLREASPQGWLDKEWFDALSALQLKQHVLPARLVDTGAPNHLSPREVIFPLPPLGSEPLRFVDLVRSMYGAIVPTDEVAPSWIDLVTEWQRWVHSDLKLKVIRLEDLAQKIGSLKTLDGLAETLRVHCPREPVVAITWLNHFLGVLLSCGQQRLLDDNALLPDQTGAFRTRHEVKRDEKVDRTLKDISALLGKDVSVELLDQRVAEAIQLLLPALNSDLVSTSLLVLLTTKAKPQYASDEFRKANAALFAWFVAGRMLDSLKRFPILSCDTDDANHELPAKDREGLLAPIDVWPATARDFADLFPAQSRASSVYSGSLHKEEWIWLSDNGLFILDPVVRRSAMLTGDDLLALIQTSPNVDAEDHDHGINIEDAVDILHLNLITDAIRSSGLKTVQFLSFVCTHVLPTTGSSLDYRSLDCQCGEQHMVHTAVWVPRLKGYKWVNERKGHADTPSASNLSKHWRTDTTLSRKITDDRVILFLRRLGVSPFELQRHVSNIHEDDSNQMEKALVMLFGATKGDSTKIQRLAEIISSDPTFLMAYEEKIKQQERIRLNQQIGTSIETLFKEVFKASELVSLGLRIERTGWGSDFCLEHDLLDENGEVAFSLQAGEGKKFFIELKSTFGSAVSMSDKQGGEAAKNAGAFALCVVPLTETEAASSSSLRERARFVPKIGDLLSDKVGDVKVAQELLIEIASSSGDVDVLLEGNKVHYRVKEPVWSSGLQFQEFIEFLLKFFGRSMS